MIFLMSQKLFYLKLAIFYYLIFSLTSIVQAQTTEPTNEKEFVGSPLCTACHRDVSVHWSHTIHAKVFDQNPRNEMEERGCEACHGPGSEHIKDPTVLDGIIRFTFNSVTPVKEQNQTCLQCHQGDERIHWMSSVHESNDLACSDCHNPMAQYSRNNLLARSNINETCFLCHKEQRSQFSRRSHMPLLEGKMACTDCHNPHGSTTDALLMTDTVNQTCYKCHAEKRGPFIFEHAPVSDNCLNCHAPHGSNHEKLLITARPMLCQQCHTSIGHMNDLFTRGTMASGSRPDGRLIGRSCQNCHSQVHGSNHPSGPKFQR